MQFGKNVFELFCKHRHQLNEQGMLIVEVGVVITCCPTQDAAYHVTCTCVRWQLPVCNGEADSADMVGQYTKCYVLFAVCVAVLFTRYRLYFSYCAGEQV